MKFQTPAGKNPIDRMKVVGKPHDRVEGPLKVTGAAPYAYERHSVIANQAYGEVVGAAIAKGRIISIDLAEARRAAGVIAILTAENAGGIGRGDFIFASPLAGPLVEHYHQAVAVVVAESLEQARAAAALVRVDYDRADGVYDLSSAKAGATKRASVPDAAIGDFATAFATAPVKLDAVYTTPDQSHMAMEPHATIAAWDGDRLNLWTSVQALDWAMRDLPKILKMPRDKVHMSSPYIGGGFGGKISSMSDAALAALAARVAGCPVKLALTRTLLVNNTVHRPATIQRVRIGAARDGKILAIGHENWTGNLPDAFVEQSTVPTPSLYAGANRLATTRVAVLDLPEGSSMRAPGEAPGMMAIEIAMDELAELLGMDPIQVRLVNDTQVDPSDPNHPFSTRQLAECLHVGSERFGWSKRAAKPGARREGQWLIGMGVASAIRGARTRTSAARARLDAKGIVTIETDMTDIGTGAYTILAQTAAEMMGIGLDDVVVKLGESDYPVSVGSIGQRGAASASGAVFAACTKLRQTIAQQLSLPEGDVDFVDGHIVSGGRRIPLGKAAAAGEIVVEDVLEFGPEMPKKYAQQAFGAHFVEVAVHASTGEIRVRRMLAVCAAGRILNPKTARSQVIGAMTMGVGAALSEELAIDTRFGYFVNHDLAGYEVAVHADIPHQEVIFIDEVDPTITPTKAKGVGELGLVGVAAAVANAIYNATGVRVRDYPIRLDKFMDRLPAVA
ncbi:aldehyde oxidoreductase molybdenum-binding subunit PaoC [Sphingomonas sp. BIUV-7]|uniref:Aldehyde oxidoreductase molybdenum-binding subunit PaoC n=1 Tax=Sphingomonas natans TaxID=3063330 RepID=A0ABT8Y6U7_9SPHN|nr:aldehyde oxidoreductase molybdenum-binding subunit PaoC [Sphingomonas sp. BIUV-7]MDO6414046.1 aldehyde oxidoreductase molybdenum-binding subunit PaoC [Sphingomonas sp. BIUV-7]